MAFRRENKFCFPADLKPSKSSFVLLGFAVLSMLPFLEFFLNSDKVLLYRDLSQVVLPAKQTLFQGLLAEGRIPRWDYLQSCGYPFYAQPVAAALYIFNLVLFLFDPRNLPQAVTLQVVIHYPFIFLGFYCLLRQLKVNASNARIFALVYAWSGYSLTANNLLHVLSGVLSLPWFIFFWLKSTQTKGAVWLFPASFFLALPVYGGDPQFSYIFLLGVIVHLISFPDGLKARLFFLLLALSFLASAAQLIPTLEVYLDSQRAASNYVGDAKFWSISPIRLFEFIFPNMFGTLRDESSYWYPKEADSPSSALYIQSIYLGFLPMYLFLWAACSGWLRRQWIRKRSNKLLLGAGILFLLLSMGGSAPLPIYRWASDWIPVWASFRYPERLSIYFLLILILLAAPIMRVHDLALRLAKPKKAMLSLLVPALIILSFSGSAWFAFKDRPNAGWPQIHTILLTFLLCIYLLVLITKSSSQIKKIFWITLILADFIPLFPQWIWLQPASFAEAESYPTTVKIISDLEKRRDEIAGGASDRLLASNAGFVPWLANADRSLFDGTISYAVLSYWEALSANLPSYFGIPSVFGSYSFELRERKLLMDALALENRPLLMHLFGVRYVLLHSGNEPPQARVIDKSLPNFFFSNDVIFFSEHAALVSWFLSQKLDSIPKTAVEFLSGEEPPKQFSQSQFPKVKILHRDSGRAEFEIEAEESHALPLFFTWNQSFFKKWVPYFDGKRLPLIRMNGWALGVELEAMEKGSHRLEFRYDDLTIQVGTWLTILWFLCALGFTLLRVRRR